MTALALILWAEVQLLLALVMGRVASTADTAEGLN
jgi:hypothetical protein